MTDQTATSAGWHSWLTTTSPESRRQARLGQLYRQWLAFRKNPAAMVGLLIVLALLLLAAFAPLVAPHDPLAQALDQRLLAPSARNWFGTDALGRDIFSRIVYGTRVTLVIVMLVVITVGPLGLLIGCAAGYFGGWVDTVLMRITDVFLAFPRLVLALAFVAALGPGLENAVIAIAFTAWPPYARVARAETMLIRNADYISAMRLQGASQLRIVLKHVVPMCVPSLIVRTTYDMAGIIIIAAGLGFLGLGAQPPIPEWGAMISTGREQIFDQWWVATFPGLAICVVALGFNLLGDGLRDVLDAR
ncbi:nickel transporter permease [Bosea sp. (in: a-proteobacteria)]|uniref:nickel transporter permease n=1 Tax=Bosea sp. (in: a-proteobacteria) TaxID=1871050 RepID=UPI00086E501C|nr:nickel transporter permease [Bosea sp. (in: a-proteobacteria)]MBN9439973.1 ABC transporter permease [Bosea sp. (in: a-proteobacteria)]MBN9467461.1 ABC transporter permease [Bosea sp. (in: a-proteobacteria)]ODT45612.1 MAG: D-ala-D-ala transporter subunit [Methylobacterium sp. SCN 67-24]